MAYVRNPVVYVPDLTNGRPIVDGKVYLLTSGTIPPMHDSTIDPADLLTVTYINEAGNTVEQPQPLYTSKGGCLYGNFPDAARQFMIAPQAYVFAAYNRIGELQYSAETSASDYVETDTLAAVGSTVLVGGVEARDLVSAYQSECHIEAFSDLVVGDNWTAALLAAIQSIRANPVSILDNIGGSIITAYSTGTIIFGRRIYKLSPDVLNITQDLGLTLKGQGSRRTNNSVRAATTLLFVGASSGYGFRQYGNGGRGFSLVDLDVCYESASFTGDLIDNFNSPGLTMSRVFVGTYGLTAPTRLQTARSCLRTTYDEFIHLEDFVFDGAVDPLWLDDVRNIGGNPFGGAEMTLTSGVIYDFTGSGIRKDGTTTHSGLVMTNVVVNPISVDPSRGVNISNIDGLVINGFLCAGSVSNAPSVEWVKISGCTGSIAGLKCDANAVFGEINGNINFSGNRNTSDGPVRFTGGVITGGSNEYKTAGVEFSPTTPLAFSVGPDRFDNPVTYSYDIPADSVNISGFISYNTDLDASVNKFRNTSGRVSISNVDSRQITFSDTSYIFNKINTGRHFIAGGSATQNFILPAGTSGLTVTVSKISNQILDVTATTFYAGVGATKSNIRFAASDIGGTVTLRSYADGGWFVESISGTATLT